MSDRIEIKGGAGEEEAAAIAAVIGAITAEEKAALATQRRPIHRSQWVEAARPMDPQHAPLPSETRPRPMRDQPTDPKGE